MSLDGLCLSPDSNSDENIHGMPFPAALSEMPPQLPSDFHLPVCVQRAFRLESDEGEGCTGASVMVYLSCALFLHFLIEAESPVCVGIMVYTQASLSPSLDLLLPSSSVNTHTEEHILLSSNFLCQFYEDILFLHKFFFK